jgi:hypothetical protein
MLSWYLFLDATSLQHVSGTSQAPKRSEPPFFCFIFTSPAGGYALVIKLYHLLSCGFEIKRFEAVRSGGRSRNAITHRQIGTIITKR